MAVSRTKRGSEAKKKQGKIVGDMRPARNGSWMLARTKKTPAITQFFSEGMGDRYRLSILKPKTGKTHQIRVALKSVSMPIAGDKRYGGEESDRTYLHAFEISFEYLGDKYFFRSWPSTGVLFDDIRFKEAFERLTGGTYGDCATSKSKLAWHI